jgi:CBS domain-containing protein
MRAQRILEQKGHDVVSIPPGRTVADAVRLLVEHGIGSVVVREGDSLEGILTERDILHLAARDASSLADTNVEEVMTRDLVVARPEDPVERLMELMTRHRVRHLPVVEDGTLLGLVSIGDVVNALRLQAQAENDHLRHYVQGMVR